MKMSARVLAASEIWHDILRGSLIDQAVKSWSLANRYAGSGDRRAITAILYAMARNRYSFGGGDDLAMALAICDHEGLGQSRELHQEGLEHPLENIRQAYENIEVIPSFGHEIEMPEWLKGYFVGGVDAIQGLHARAGIVLREHPHRPLMDHQELLSLGFSRTSMSPIGWEKPHEDKRMHLEELTAFQDGFLEVQDEASQMACLLLAPGLTGKMLDYCAGGGGKSLLITSANPSLKVFVHDHEPKRMRDVPARFGRAKLTVPSKWDQFDRDFDLVLADVPCTGSGTWRRQPERRWQCDQNELAGLLATQAKILRKTAALVRPGGLLAYMTCSLLENENMGQVSAFLESSEEFDALPLAEWPGMSGQFPLPYLRGQYWLQWSPHVDGTDGFFMALLKKRAA